MKILEICVHKRYSEGIGRKNGNDLVTPLSLQRCSTRCACGPVVLTRQDGVARSALGRDMHTRSNSTSTKGRHSRLQKQTPTVKAGKEAFHSLFHTPTKTQKPTASLFAANSEWKKTNLLDDLLKMRSCGNCVPPAKFSKHGKYPD